MERLLGIITMAVLLVPCGAARAGTIYFQKTWDGAQLNADSSLGFPAVVPRTLDGTTLRWGDVPNNTVPSGSNGAAFAKFLEIPMVAPGVLEADAKVRVTVDFELSRTAVPFVPAMTVFDAAPNGYYYYGAELATFNANSLLAVRQGRFGDGVPIDDIGDYSEFEDGWHLSPEFVLDSTPPDAFVGQLYWDFATDRFGAALPGHESAGAGAGSPWPGDGPLAHGNLNFARALSFVFWLHPSSDSSGGITSLALRVEQVPEPALATLLMVSLLGAPMLRGRKSAHAVPR